MQMVQMQRNANSDPTCLAASASPATGGTKTHIDKHFWLTMLIADIFIKYNSSLDRLQQPETESCLFIYYQLDADQNGIY